MILQSGLHALLQPVLPTFSSAISPGCSLAVSWDREHVMEHVMTPVHSAPIGPCTFLGLPWDRTLRFHATFWLHAYLRTAQDGRLRESLLSQALVSELVRFATWWALANVCRAGTSFWEPAFPLARCMGVWSSWMFSMPLSLGYFFPVPMS